MSSTLWTPLFSFVVLAVFFGFGDFVSYKTKGLVSTIVVASLLYMVGFWTGVIPTDSLTSTQLPGVMSAFGIALMILNLGTIIDLEDLLKEWKTVAIAMFGLVGLTLFAFTAGTWMFGRQYALAATPPISGGLIAGIIVNEAAQAAGQPAIGGYASLLVGLQMFIGMPVASWMLKKYANNLLAAGKIIPGAAMQTEKKINIKFIPDFPKSMQSATITMAKMGIVGFIAYNVAMLTKIPASAPANYILNPNIAYLLFGIIFTEIGFLDKNSLAKSGAAGFLMLGTMSILPGSLAAITPAALLEMIVPLVGMLVFGAIAISIFAVILGKFLHYEPSIAIAIGLTALIGYPGTQVITDEVVAGLECSEEEKAAVKQVLLPKMLVGGFVTVTIASVVLAGLVAPYIFV